MTFDILSDWLRAMCGLSAAKITSDLNISLTKLVKMRTVCNYLKELGLEYVLKVKRQRLSIKHRQK